MISTIMVMLLTNSLFFIICLHSISSMLVLILHSLLISLMIYMKFKISLISFSLILSYTSGLLIIFSYILNMDSNPVHFIMKFKFMMAIMLLIFILNYFNLDLNLYIHSDKNCFFNYYLKNYGGNLMMMIMILFMTLLSSLKMIRKYKLSMKFI